MPTRARLVHALGALALLLGSCAAPSHDADPHVDAAMEVGTGGDASATGLAAPLDQPAHPIVGGFVRTASPPSGLVPSCLIDTSLADFQAGVLTSCDATTTPGDVTLVVLPLLDQQNTTVTSNGFGFTATSWAGQTFVPTTSGPLNRIDLDLFCSGCSGTTPNIAVSVRATSGNPGVPTGADLATATIPGFNSSTGTYFTATFATPLTVTAGTQYAVVMRPVSNPSAGVYAYVCSCTTSTNPYAPGSRVTSSNSGASWTADVTAGGRDMGFSIYIGSGFVTSGTFASSVKDANPSSGETVHWTTLAWNATTPASTTLQFQVAPSNDPAGPFSFVGPDGTASTFFHSGDSLSQFDGNRYLEYQALFATSDTAQTAALQDVTTCFSNASSTVTTTLVVSPASAAFSATVDLTATLSATGSGLANRIVSFALNGTPVGGAITDAQGAASVTGVSLTGVEPGTYVGAVVASYDGEAGFTASAGSNDLTVSPAAQTLTFAALPNKLVTDPAFTLGATGGASGNPVTFTTSSVACSVSGTTVTLVSTGTCAIQADQAGNTEYSAAAPVTQSFTITLATQTITFPAITSFSWSGGSATLAATASSALTVAYSVSSGPCSVAGTTLTATSAGTCVVAANQAGNGSYSAAPQVTASAAVTTAGQAISFGALANKLMTDGAFSVSATGGASGNPVTFSTSSAACSVAGTTVTLVSAGTCAVQADQAGNANYTAAAPVTQSFTIARATQTITFPAITSFSWSGGSATLAATASSALTVSYSVSSGPCSVAGTTLTASAAGTCVVAANQAGNGSYGAAAQVVATATVAKSGQTIAFPAIANFSWRDGSAVLAATATSVLPVSYSVLSGPCVVTGSTLTATAAGACVVAANQAGDANYLAAPQTTTTATIANADQAIVFPDVASFSWLAGSAPLAATASSALPVGYSVLSGPCSVDGATLTAMAAGSCVIAANQAGDSNFAAAPQVTAMVTVARADQALVFGELADRQATDPTFAVAAPGTGSTSPVTFSTSSTACIVMSNLVMLVSAGTCTIQADQQADANYNAAVPVQQSFAISFGSQTIELPPVAAFAWNAGPATLGATASSALAVSYSVVSGPCQISAGALVASTAGTCVVAADQAGDARYAAAPQVMTSVTVAKADQHIVFLGIEVFPASGGSSFLPGTASSALAVSYAVISGPCVVTADQITATAPGTCVVAADQAGDGSYNPAAQVVVSVVVTDSEGGGCSCSTTSRAPGANFLFVLVALVVRRRRRSR